MLKVMLMLYLTQQHMSARWIQSVAQWLPLENLLPVSCLFVKVLKLTWIIIFSSTRVLQATIKELFLYMNLHYQRILINRVQIKRQSHTQHDQETDQEILTIFGLGGQIGPLPGFSSITQKPFNQSSPNFVSLIIHI